MDEWIRQAAALHGDGSAVVDCYLFLAAAIVITRCLIQRARTRYRWPGRPTTRRLK